MKLVHEFRDPVLAERYGRAIARATTRPWTLMEVCGGQTHAIVKHGIDALLPPEVELIHGPGCPVCVTPVEILDIAMQIAARPDVVFCSFGDMLRVPGSHTDLARVKAAGGDVRIVYCPLDALAIAEREPDRQVVFLAVGFETTAPANGMAVARAAERGIQNFSLLVSHVLVPPAMEAILQSDHNRVQAFLAAGHVCTIMGTAEYEPLAERYRVPIVVTGFEPIDILQGVLMCVRQLEQGRADVENQYARSVRAAGNEAAQALLREVFEVVPRIWRGIGEIPASGLALTERYAAFDAMRKLAPEPHPPARPSECLSGEILTGRRKPHECPAFGARCTPEQPLGAPMVSSEGACAAYFHYRSPSADRGAS